MILNLLLKVIVGFFYCIKARPNECYNAACYMLQSRMRQNRIRLATAFHATYNKLLCNMLHAKNEHVHSCRM